MVMTRQVHKAAVGLVVAELEAVVEGVSAHSVSPAHHTPSPILLSNASLIRTITTAILQLQKDVPPFPPLKNGTKLVRFFPPL